MKKVLSLALLLSVTLLNSAGRAQSAATPPPQTGKQLEAYLRNYYAFGADIQVAVGPFTPTGIAGLFATNVDVTVSGNKQTVKFYVSADGKYLVQGELSDMARDPLAENRAKMDLKNAPTMGSATASVTVVEYSDFECPVCRNLHDGLRAMLPNYKDQVRVVFKDYPIEQIHPWARTAALGGRCTYDQKPEAFWKFYDLVYDQQELISAANAYEKMLDYASQTGLNSETFKACMASAEAGAAVDASRANGLLLDVNSTPTIFVNGRRIVGADGHSLEQFIQYEIAKAKSAKSDDRK